MAEYDHRGLASRRPTDDGYFSLYTSLTVRHHSVFGLFLANACYPLPTDVLHIVFVMILIDQIAELDRSTTVTVSTSVLVNLCTTELAEQSSASALQTGKKETHQNWSIMASQLNVQEISVK